MSTDKSELNRVHQTAWRRRPAAAALVRVAVVAIPLALSVGVAMLLELVVPEPSALVGRLAWWIGILGISSVSMLGFERVARRALPLAALLTMGMLFPSAAPKRLAVARRAASTRGLERRLEEARLHGLSDEPVEAAERIVGLAASMSAHDRRTRGHTERVRALTDMVADELRLPEVDRDRLRWSALLHDIGKLAVHENILNKEGPLTDDEWQAIRQHPIEGARLTAPLSSWLGEWASTIAEHHERYDGGGYPYGLAGDAISLGGRIVAVADTYDVMTSARSYKTATSPEMARTELARCAGTQFDPVIVRAFLAVPIRRLRGLLPLSWLGSLPFRDSVLAGIGRATAGLVVAGSVIGMTALEASSGGVSLAATARAQGNRADSNTNVGTIGGTLARLATGAGVTGRIASTGGDSNSDNGVGPPGSLPGSVPGDTGFTGSSGGGKNGSGPANDQSGSTTTSSGAPGTTIPGVPTTVPGTSPTTSSVSPPTTGQTSPPTTSHGSSPPTTGNPPPPTTTTTTIPVPAPPTGLSANSSCEAIILEPEVALRWTDSGSSWVTSYEVLRSSNGSSYSVIKSGLSPSTTTYSDTGVSGFGTEYWYKIEAVSPEGSALSSSVETTTPGICL